MNSQISTEKIFRSEWMLLVVVAILILITFFLFRDMETYFIDQLNALITNQKLYVFFSFLILFSDIVLPVPSSIVMYLNGFVLGIPAGAILSLISLMGTALVGYWIGNISNRGRRMLPANNSGILLSKYGALAILMTRGIPVLSESICIVCGYRRFPIKNYLLLNFAGYLPICIIYAVFGSWGSEKNLFFISFAVAIGVSALFWIFGRSFLLQTRVE
jgi:uncharacterized membrane protein YdjX (TVP38/TMEM64 family)